VLLRRRCCGRAAVIDISCPPGPQQQTRRTLLQQSIAGTDTLAAEPIGPGGPRPAHFFGDVNFFFLYIAIMTVF